MPPTPRNDRDAFESEIQALEAQVANAGAHFTLDASARQAYSRQIKAMADELRNHASSGRMTWKQAAEQAHETRNAILEVMRGRSTPVGRAFAEQMKSTGKTLNELIANKTLELHGPNANFAKLSVEQQNGVYAKVVTSAGKSNPRVNALMRKLSRAGRGLLFLSVALSVYDVMTAEDRAAAARREAVVTGAGILGGIGGGMATGMVAGLACGPAAPVCVTVGAFIGGAAAAFGADLFF